MPRIGYAQVAATLALGIAVAAAVEAYSDDEEPAPSPAATATRPDEPAPETVPRADFAERARDAARLRGRSPSDFAPSSSLVTRAPVRLRKGQTRRVLRRSPFTVTARCVQAERGLTEVQLMAVSSERGGYVSAAGRVQPLRARRERLFLQLISRRRAVGPIGFALVERGGRPLQGLMSFGVGTLGRDCFAAPTAVG